MAGRKAGKARLSGTVAALAQAALALPGVAAASDVQTDYLFSWYHEADVPAERASSGRDTARYDIQSHLFRLVAPADGHELGLDLTYESMSGASPWYVMPGPGGKPVQVMSGASIAEKRTALDGHAALLIPHGRVTVDAGASDERDYRSLSGGVSAEKTDRSGTFTLSGGVHYSDDHLSPTQGAAPTAVLEADKNTTSGFAGLAVVLDAQTVVQAGAGVTRNAGYLADPYKEVYVESGPQIVAEARPDRRVGFTGTLKLRRHFRGPDAALHLDYRYYHDDWKIDSHTLELAWHQRLALDWRVVPSVRWYSQSQAFFYGAYFPALPADGFRSSDYRLSPFGALAARLDVVREAGPLNLGAGLEWYEADARYAAGSVAIENPGLVRYLSGQVRVSYRF